MKITTATIIFWILQWRTAKAGLGVVFDLKGSIAPSTTYGHICFHLDLQHTMDVIANTSKQLNRQETEVHLLIHNNNLSNSYTAEFANIFDQHEQELNRMTRRLGTFTEIIGKEAGTESRQKRQLFMGLASVIGIGLGLYQEEEISQLKTAIKDDQERTNNLITVIEKQSTSIKKNTEILKNQEAKFNVLVDNFRQEHARGMIESIKNSITDMMTANNMEAMRWMNGLEVLITEERISPFLIDQEQLQEEFNKLMQQARIHGLAPVFGGGPYSAYRAKTTLTKTNKHEVMGIIHIPLSQDKLFDVYRYLPVPINVEGTTVIAKPRKKHNVLALNQERSLYAEFDESFLTGCLQHSRSYFCEEPLILRKDLEQSCLLGLFLKKPKTISKRCQLSFVEEKEELIRIDKYRFLIYAPRKTTVRLVCGKNGTSEVIQGTKEYRVAPGCSFSSDQLYVKMIPTIRTKGDVIADTVEWELANLILEDKVTINRAYTEFKSLDKDEAEVQAMVQQVKQMDPQDVQQSVAHLNVIVGLIIIFLIGFIVLFFVRKRALSKNNTANKE